MIHTYGQLEDGITSFDDFQKKVAHELRAFPFLQWKNKKTVKLARKLYKQGYNVSDAVGMIIMNT